MGSIVSHKFWRDIVVFHIIPVLFILLLFIGAFFFVAIPSTRESLMEARRNKIKDLSRVAWNIVHENYRKAQAGEITPEEAKQKACEQLKTIRYGSELEDYFWISNIDYELEMHPYRPDLVGENLYDFKDPSGVYLFREFADLVKDQGEGYVQYMWQLQGNTNQIMAKVSYVMSFDPWGWCVGTGIYLEEVERQIDAITKNVRNAFYGITLIMALIGAYVIYQAYKIELQKQTALESVKESEQRFRAIYDDSVQFMGLLDLEGRILDTNKTALNFIEKPLEEIKGQFFWESPWWSHDVKEQMKLRTAFGKCIQKGEALSLETHQKNKDGDLLYIDFSLKPICDQNDNIIQIIPEGRDITSRKKFEAELARKNEELSEARQILIAAIENSPAGIIIADAPDVRIRIANKTALNFRGGKLDKPISGMTMDELYKNWEIFHLDGSPYEVRDMPISRAILNGERIENEQLFIQLKDGEKRRVIVNAAPIRDMNNEIVSAIVVFLDITEEAELRERLAQSEKMQAIGHLAGGIAHDFNNMLGGIRGATELLSLQLGKDHTGNECIKMIEGATTRAAELTQKLLSFSRTGKRISYPLDLHTVIKNACDLLERSIDKRIALSIDLAAESTTVIGDPTLLQNAILNLGINARDAIAENGEIIISTKNVTIEGGQTDASDRFIELTVEDNGSGMPNEVKDHIFDPFFTTKEEGKGTGLGLASVYRAVTDHQGEISVQSKADHGTTFTIRLPVDESSIVKEIEERKEAVRGEGCVLLVDDEQIIRTTTGSLLRKLGYTVMVAEDGKAAVDIYRKFHDRIDVVLTDVVMPRMGGRDAYHALQKINPDVKVIFCSGFTRDPGLEEKIQEEGLEFLSKPYTQAALSNALANTLKPGHTAE